MPRRPAPVPPVPSPAPVPPDALPGSKLSPKAASERLGQGGLHGHHLLGVALAAGRRRRAVEDDHALELRQLRLRRLQVQRLHVQQRVLDGHHQQVAHDHLRALLAPERALGADLRVLVDGRLDLAGAEHRVALGEDVVERLAVVRHVGAGAEPGDHVLAAVRHERQHEQELLLGGARQLHDHVVGLHAARAGERHVVGDRPLVALVVEDVGAVHVVGGVHLGLHVEVGPPGSAGGRAAPAASGPWA